jgi:hypothetical protein
VEVVELTKRQRGLVSGGGVDVMGPKFKPPEDPASKTHCFAWSEEGAQAAWDDLMHGEPCVFITPDSVYVGGEATRVFIYKGSIITSYSTSCRRHQFNPLPNLPDHLSPPPCYLCALRAGTRHKRAMCKNTGGLLKTVKDVEKFIAELKPDAPLKSVSFAGNEPPSVNGYNVILAGSFKLDGPVPPAVGHVNTTSCTESRVGTHSRLPGVTKSATWTVPAVIS